MESIGPGDALLVVDVQYDFLPGGALAVPDGAAVIPVLSRYCALFHSKGLPIIATRDWHPSNHCSFHEQGGSWPAHCIAQTPGAQFPEALQLPPSTIVISKGTDPEREAYSGFQETSLHQYLQSRGVTRLFVGGLATDYCVLQTVRDARLLGYGVWLLLDAVQAVNLHPEDGQKAETDMSRLGAVPLRWEQLTA
ncbi:MAG: isochorismatase family protein [Nitrospira defluvii]|nr:isochorismatase family protein [Nitrospira defluvii]